MTSRGDGANPAPSTRPSTLADSPEACLMRRKPTNRITSAIVAKFPVHLQAVTSDRFGDFGDVF